MQKTCRQCQTAFEINTQDVAFYDKISPIFPSGVLGTSNGKKYAVPAPTLCPDCRAERRLAFRNERKLYHRKCDLTGKQIISIYSADKNYKVYDQKEWWSDKWDGLEHGRSYDFNKSFFEQFYELMLVVPRPAILNRNSENSEYTNICEDNKNCYLLVESSTNEDCLYGYWLQKSRDCVDCSYATDCELCYECDNCQNCYNLRFSQNCTQCRDSSFLKNCSGCKDCLACVNLQQKHYCIFNEQYSKEAYFEKLADFGLNRYSRLTDLGFKFNQFKQIQPHKFGEIYASEDCSGNYISHSKNCHDCYNASEAWDCRYSVHVWRNAKNNMDVDTAGMNSELNYECINTAINSSRNLFCARCWGVHESFYCNECDYSRNLFGCVGLRRKQYCILNKQYTRDEYEALVPRIIEHMSQTPLLSPLNTGGTIPYINNVPFGSTSEWGEFFPIEISPFGYNETVAQEYFPMEKEAVLAQGWKWHEEESSLQKYLGPEVKIPDNISEVDESICEKILLCEVTGKPYKIIPQEWKFYKKMDLPIPRKCPDQRHKERLNLRNPRKLLERMCGKCRKSVKTTYVPDRPEVVYCEECYLKEVY